MHRPVRVDDLAGAAPAIHVRPGVGRVAQDPGGAGVGEPAPPQLPGPCPAVGAAREPPPGERPGHPVGRPGGGERGEHVADRGGDLLIRIDGHAAVIVVDQADRQRDAQLAAPGGGLLGLVHPAGQPVELCFRHLALESQQQPVVDVGQVIDAVVVDDQGGCQAGQFQQAGQVRVGAGKPGDFQAEHRPDLAQADPGDQVLEPVAVRCRAPGQAQVGIDHLDGSAGPAQPGGLPGQVVLAQRGLGVLADLHQRRLADVYDRRPLQVSAGHLLLPADHRRPPAPVRAGPRERTRPCSPAPRSSLPAHARPAPDPAPARHGQRAWPSPVPAWPAVPG